MNECEYCIMVDHHHHHHHHLNERETNGCQRWIALHLGGDCNAEADETQTNESILWRQIYGQTKVHHYSNAMRRQLIGIWSDMRCECIQFTSVWMTSIIECKNLYVNYEQLPVDRSLLSTPDIWRYPCHRYKRSESCPNSPFSWMKLPKWEIIISCARFLFWNIVYAHILSLVPFAFDSNSNCRHRHRQTHTHNWDVQIDIRIQRRQSTIYKTNR